MYILDIHGVGTKNIVHILGSRNLGMFWFKIKYNENPVVLYKKCSLALLALSTSSTLVVIDV